MREIDHNEVIRRAERIASIQLAPEVTRRALDKACAAVRSQPARKPWPWRMTAVVGTAALAASLALVWLAGWDQRVWPRTPQARLERALRQMQEYPGWIEARPQYPLLTTVSAGLLRGKEERYRVAIRAAYFNNTTSAEALVGDRNGTEFIILRADGIDQEIYDGSTNTVRCCTVGSGSPPLWPRGIRCPLNAGQLAAWCRELLEADDARLAHKSEDGYDRFELVTHPASRPATNEKPDTAEVAALPVPKPAAISQLTVWAHPRNRLVDRAAVIIDGRTYLTTFKYPPGEIDSVFHLGAPVSATILDQRDYDPRITRPPRRTKPYPIEN